MQNKLFKKSSVERFSSPEKLNDYIQVSNPSSWMVLGAALALLIGLLVWGFFGEITNNTSFTGVVRDGKLQCYVGSAVSASLAKDLEVTVSPMSDATAAQSTKARVISIADRPLSYAEASALVDGDYLLAVLGVSNWNIAVEISPDEPLYEDMVYTIVAVTDVQRPIDLVFQ